MLYIYTHVYVVMGSRLSKLRTCCCGSYNNATVLEAPDVGEFCELVLVFFWCVGALVIDGCVCRE